MDNFEFVKNIDENKLYTYLHKMESWARIDAREAGKIFRDVSERFFKTLMLSRISEEELERFYTYDENNLIKMGEKNPYERRPKSMFTLKNAMDAIKTVYKDDLFKDISSLLMEKVEYEVECPNGSLINKKGEIVTKIKNPYHMFLRHLGNNAAHEDIEGDVVYPKINYRNLVLALSFMHRVIAAAYKVSGIPEYSENYMPIDGYEIYSYSVPHDRDVTGCSLELLGKKYDDIEDDTDYVLFRIYDIRSIVNIEASDESYSDDLMAARAFAARNTSFIKAVKKLDENRSLPSCFTVVSEVTEFGKREQGEFYITEYLFEGEPVRLDKFELKSLTLEERKAICKEIAGCFDKIHHYEKPIYNRMLNPSCIYIATDENDGRKLPYVVKFEYSKINTNKYTMIDNLRNTSMINLMLSDFRKYMAPEVDSIIEKRDNGEFPFENAAWEKADIYSLGMLFIDILYGEIAVDIPDAEELLDMGLDEELLELLYLMIDDDMTERPELSEVMQLL